MKINLLHLTGLLFFSFSGNLYAETQISFSQLGCEEALETATLYQAALKSQNISFSPEDHKIIRDIHHAASAKNTTACIKLLGKLKEKSPH